MSRLDALAGLPCAAAGCGAWHDDSNQLAATPTNGQLLQSLLTVTALTNRFVADSAQLLSLPTGGGFSSSSSSSPQLWQPGSQYHDHQPDGILILHSSSSDAPADVRGISYAATALAGLRQRLVAQVLRPTERDLAHLRLQLQASRCGGSLGGGGGGYSRAGGYGRGVELDARALEGVHLAARLAFYKAEEVVELFDALVVRLADWGDRWM